MECVLVDIEELNQNDYKKAFQDKEKITVKGYLNSIARSNGTFDLESMKAEAYDNIVAYLKRDIEKCFYGDKIQEIIDEIEAEEREF
jgi:hypothetical protein